MYRFSWPQTLASFAAALLLMVTLVAAIFLPNPSDYQLTLIRLICALCSAAIVNILPGMLELKFEGLTSKVLRASGSLAVFVLVYALLPDLISIKH